MSKEEILDSIVRDWATPVTRQDCYAAMDIHSRETAVAFAEWIDGCGYSRIAYDDKYGEWTEGNEVVAETTDQLFNLFMQSINAK